MGTAGGRLLIIAAIVDVVRSGRLPLSHLDDTVIRTAEVNLQHDSCGADLKTRGGSASRFGRT